MKTKIGLPLGLALVMFIGIFTTMLALGALNPQPAEAAITADFAVTLSDSEAEAQSDWSFSIVSTVDFAASNTMTVEFPAGFDITGSGVTTAANWSLGNAAPASAAVSSQVVTLTAGTEMTTIAGSTVAAPTSIPVSFSAPEVDDDPETNDNGIVNPSYDVAPVDVKLKVDTGNANDIEVESGAIHIMDSTLDSVTVTNDPTDPGAATQFQISFQTEYVLEAGIDSIRLDIDSSVGIPTTLSAGDVRITATEVSVTDKHGQSITPDLDPVYRLIPGREGRVLYTITVPNMNSTDTGGVANISADATVTVSINQGAGFTNPTEAGPDDITVSTNEQTIGVKATFDTPVTLTIDDAADNRNKPLTVTGKGFRNGTTAIVYLDKNDDGSRNAGDVDLVSVIVGSDDTFEATFNVTVPPFEAGTGNAEDGWNRIAAVDGEAPKPNQQVVVRLFEVEGLMTISPKTAAVGDDIQISLVDWAHDLTQEKLAIPIRDVNDEDYDVGAVTKYDATRQAVLLIGDVMHDLPKITISNGSADFEVTVANNVPSGTQQLEFITYDAQGSTAKKEGDDTSVVISGASVIVTPVMVVPQQSISVIGRGFGDRAKINTGDGDDDSLVTLGGNTAHLGSGDDNFNNDRGVRTDSGGNWNASIIIPITEATTTPGTHILDILDSSGRSGSAEIVIADRTITLEPALARPGETVMLTGSGFPATNSRRSEQTTPSVEVTYAGDRVATVTPDSNGNISASFKVPTDKAIPSTNQVRAQFTFVNENNEEITAHASRIHEIPGATITLSASEGKPGDTLTVTGKGFKAFESVRRLEIGGRDVIPSPKPATNRVGAFTASILIPDMATGSHSVEVQFGSEELPTISSAIFNIVEATTEPMMPGMMNEASTPAMAFAPVTAEDNLVKVFHFDPATQNEAPNYGWTIYDARPLFMATNTLDMIEPGGFYFLQVTSNQMDVEIGGMTMNLYAGLNPVQW